MLFGPFPVECSRQFQAKNPKMRLKGYKNVWNESNGDNTLNDITKASGTQNLTKGRSTLGTNSKCNLSGSLDWILCIA